MNYAFLLFISVTGGAIRRLWRNPWMLLWLLLWCGPWIAGPTPPLLPVPPLWWHRLLAVLVVAPLAYLFGCVMAAATAITSR
jgi:hypothetical protein